MLYGCVLGNVGKMADPDDNLPLPGTTHKQTRTDAHQDTNSNLPTLP
jgi:hypothetical protein